MTRLAITPEARADFNDIISGLYVEAGSAVAMRFSTSFDGAFVRLTEFPRIGAPRPKFGPTVRIWTIEPYVIFYRYTDTSDTVLVLRILHGRRKLTRKMLSGRS